MSLLDYAKIEATRVGYLTLFQDIMGRAPEQHKLVASVTTSTNTTESYKWLAGNPSMVEWLGDRAHQKFIAKSYDIENKHFANGVDVDMDDIADDHLGLVNMAIGDVFDEAAIHYDELVFGALSGGLQTTAGAQYIGLCYDGQYFYDTDHSEDSSGTQINKVSTVFDANGAALEAGIIAMAGFKNSDGKVMNIRPTHLVVPQALEFTARKVLQAEYLASGATNVYKDAVELVISRRLATSTEWHLLDCSRRIKPVILQIREAISFKAQDDPNVGAAYDNRVFRYGCDGRHAVGYGPWQLAYGSTGGG